ncbi:methyltransferase domain-containing protein [Rhizorhapis sp. SPR117]|uniref:methyltransferase domain-containing protein n=1 Tax=Rhizorhapis sp. SPR117 TaxID=2912611 RepID=UPI001F2EE265|nr:methyltransferase domain-containing protein [Rhizorhapis sp. SPR117]
MHNLSIRALEEEQMDSVDLPDADYAAALQGLGRVNIATLAVRPTLDFLCRAARRDRPFRLLDVGFGDGGMLRSIYRWSRRNGLLCELTGIDLNSRSKAVARALHPAGAPILYRSGDYADLAHEPWDFIVSSLVTHHMSDAERHAFLLFMERHATRGWFINDLHRHGLAYRSFPLLARLLRVHPIVREDGQLSIARSFRPAEWRAMLAAADLTSVAHVRRYFPFRLCVERRR